LFFFYNKDCLVGICCSLNTQIVRTIDMNIRRDSDSSTSVHQPFKRVLEILTHYDSKLIDRLKLLIYH